MTPMAREEHLQLVELWRRVSPSALKVTAPELRPDLHNLWPNKLTKTPRVVLFDVYGTLLVSAAGGEPGLIGQGSEAGLSARGLLSAHLAELGQTEGPEGLHDRFVAQLKTRRAEAQARVPHPEVDVMEVFADLLPGVPVSGLRTIALIHEAWKNPCAPMPGALATVQNLAASGLRLGLVSNAQFSTPLLLEALWGAPAEQFGLEPALSVYSFQLGRAKPDTLPFEVALATLPGVAPGEVLYIGNSSANDIAPARTLGLATALFAGDTRSFRPSAPGAPGAQPDLVLVDFAELPRKIGLTI